LAAGAGVLAAGSWLGLACGDDSAPGSSAAATATLGREAGPSGAPSGRLRLGVVNSNRLVSQPLSRLEQQLAYSRLIAIDPRSATVHADLASAFELVEPLEIHFTLRPDLFFHPDVEGLAAPITTELIQRRFEEQAAAGAYLFSEVVDQVTVPDSSTLSLRLRAPFALLFDSLAAPGASVRGDTRYAPFSDAVGSGPFVPAGQDPTGHALVANPRFHDSGYPRLEQVSALYYDDDAQLDEAFQRSEVDVRHHTSMADATRALERPGTQQERRAARKLRGLGLSLLPNKGGLPKMHVEAFQDERIRRAISRSLDRDALAAVDASVIASPVGAAHGADSLAVPELRTQPLYQFDPAEAAKLLQAATNEPLAFRILTSDAAGPRDYLSMVTSQLRAVGFDAQLRIEEHAVWETAFFAGDFEATLFEVGGLDTPGDGLRLHTTGGLDGRFSQWGYSNPVFDAAVKTALSQVEPLERASAMRQAQRVLLGSAPGMFPLVTPIDIASIGARLGGYEFDAYGFNESWLAAQWVRPS